MARLRINWKLIIVLLIAVGGLAVTAWGLRQWNRSRRSERGLNAGLKAYEDRQWPQAADNLGRYLGVVPDDAAILAKYADAQLKRRPLKRPYVVQAINAYRRILRMDETAQIDDVQREAAIQLVRLYLQMNVPTEAELIATQRLAKGNDNEMRRLLAVAYINQRKFTDAIVELDKIIKDDPSQVLAYSAMGQLAQRRPEDFAVGAEHWFNEAVRNNPRSAQAYIIRGIYFLENKQTSKAMSDFEQAEKLDLSDTSVRLALAEGYIKADQLDKAETHLEAVEQADPGNINLWNKWATLALKTNSQDRMRDVAGRGVEKLASEAAAFLPVAAELYIRAGDLDKAVDCMEQLRLQDAEGSLITFLEGLVNEQKGLWADALKKFRRAMEMGMQTEAVQLKIASLCVRLGDKVAAARRLKALLNKYENSYRGRYALATLLIEEGRYSEAAEHARMLTRQEPRRLDGHLLYMRARIRLLAEKKTGPDDPVWDLVEADLKRLDESLPQTPSVKTMMIYAAMQRGDLDRAQRMVDELEVQHSDELAPKLAQVDVLVARDEIDRAIENLEDIIRQFPESTLSVSYLVSLLAGRRDFSRCQDILVDAISRIEDPESLRMLNLTLAAVYERNGKTEEACRLLESVSQQLPDDIPVLRKLIAYRQATGHNDRLQELVDRIKSLEGDDGWQWRLEQARVWFGLDTEEFNKRWPEAVALLKENLNANPDDQSSRRLLAACYERAGRLHLAISLYTQALERSPDDINIIVPAVAMLYRAQRYEQANEILDRAIRENPAATTDMRLARLALQRHQRQGDLEPAADILENLLSADPENNDDRFTLALIRMFQEDYQQARQLLNQLKIMDPGYLPAVAGLVELNIRQGKRDEAINLCNETVDRLGNPQAYILRSRAYMRLAEIEKARQDMEKAISLEPDNVGNLQLKAAFHQVLGETQLAVATLEKALSLAPEDFGLLKQAAFVFMASPDRQDVERGRTLMEKAIAARADDVELLTAKAAILLRQGTAPALKEAEQLLKDTVSKHPGNERAWVMLANLYLGKDDLARAMDIVLQGLAHLPRSRTLLLTKASAEARRSPELAVGTLRQLLDERPDDIGIVLDLARTYAAAGRHDEAIKLLEEKSAIAKGPDVRRIDTALAVILYDSGKTDQATARFESLRTSQPDDQALILAYAGALAKGKAWAELTDLVVGWCNRYPDNTAILPTVVQSIISGGDENGAKTAETILRRVIANHDDCVVAVSSLAMLMHTQGKTDEAVELYEKVLSLEPDRLIAMNNLAWILCEERKDYQRARELVSRGLALNPLYADLIDTSGMIHYRMKMLDKAVEDFKKCIELYPENAPGRASSYFHLAKALEQMGDKQQALSNLRKSIAMEGLSEQERSEAEKLLVTLMQ